MSPSHEKPKTSILIVEDSPTQVQQLKQLLIHAGYIVTVATNGKEALSILETSSVNLVITDIVMPEMDGYALCKVIKEDEKFKKIPVILVTALYDPRDVIEGLVSGANNFIIKPYDEKYLLSRIESVLASTYNEDIDAIQMGLDITFAGKKHHITSSRLQILNILLSTYETAVQKNHELKEAKKQLRIINENLEDTVCERTSELEKTNRALIQEIEIRKQTEIALQRKTRAYRMISECNQFLVRTSKEDELLKGICNILIKFGGYRCVWVGIIEHDDPVRVEPVAQAGFEDEYLQILRKNLEKGQLEDSPTVMAIKTRQKVIIHNIFRQSKNESWIHEATQRDYTNVAAFPLVIKNKVIGALTIYASEPEAFDDDETPLISEMADDLAYGIQSLHIHDEQKRVEKELHKSEIRYRRLFEAAKDGILILDENSGEIIDANPYILDMIGYSYQSILGKHLWEIGLIQDKSKADEAFILLKRDGYNRYDDLPLQTAHGITRDVEFISNLYPINGSKVIQCNIRDITERKTTEAAVRESELRFREVFNAAQDGMLVTDPETHRFVLANSATLKQIGYTEKELLDLSISDIICPADLPLMLRQYDTYLHGETILSSDISILRKDGTIFFADINSSMVTLQGKKYLLGIFRDVTERKKLEDEIRTLNRELEHRVEERTNELSQVNEQLSTTNEELSATEEELRVQMEVTNEAYVSLEKSEERFRRLYESDLIGIAFADMEKIEDSNDTFLEIVRYSREDLKKGVIPWQKMTPPEWDEADITGLEELTTRGSCTPYEKEYYRKDGSRVSILFGAALLQKNPLKWVCFILDITERKLMTAQIETSLAEKEMLLKEIHHRVKNNMQVISGLLFLQAQTAKDESTRLLFKESQDRIRSISLVHELLYRSDNLNQIEYGNYLRKMFGTLFESYKIDARKVTMVIDVQTVMISIEKAVPCSLIVNELLSNSLKHAFPNGREGEIIIGFELDSVNGTYTLDYRDNGIGFPEGIVLEKTGTLGMSLLFGLTRQLNGTITRDEGNGVHFIITFPSKDFTSSLIESKSKVS